MKTIEEKLEEYKQVSNRIQAPLELEGRLRDALQRAPLNKRTNKAAAWILSTAAALILMIGVYEYPAFAYYLNKLSINSLSFSEVMEQGLGQKINKSITLQDGAVFTINGVIADDNVFRIYYTIDNRPAVTEYRSYHFERVKGILTDSKWLGGYREDSNKKDQYVGVAEFESVSPFSRTLTLSFVDYPDHGEKIAYSISFHFDASIAMKSIVKQDISQFITVDKGRIHFDSMTASPTSTVVKGRYELEETPRFPGKTMLYVNGVEVAMTSSVWSGTGFVIKYEPFPTNPIQSIELVFKNSEGYHKINEPISLASPSDRSIRVGDEKLWIRSVTKSETGYDVVIARKKFTFLDTDHLSVQAGGNIVPVSSISKERPWDLKNGNIMWEQTYSFDTTDKPEFLLVDGYQYIKAYNKKISIPVDK